MISSYVMHVISLVVAVMALFLVSTSSWPQLEPANALLFANQSTNTYLPTIQKMVGSIAFTSVTTPAANSTTPAPYFHSALETFVIPGSVNGYGAYQAHNSSIFKSGEKILLYIEPAGYSYKPVGSLFLMNFTADVLISDKAGHVLTGLQNLPISTLISHHKNKELILTVSLTQTTPFPVGDYVLKYTIRDVSSGNSFDILKNITIANG